MIENPLPPPPKKLVGPKYPQGGRGGGREERVAWGVGRRRVCLGFMWNFFFFFFFGLEGLKVKKFLVRIGKIHLRKGGGGQQNVKERKRRGKKREEKEVKLNETITRRDVGGWGLGELINLKFFLLIKSKKKSWRFKKRMVYTYNTNENVKKKPLLNSHDSKYLISSFFLFSFPIYIYKAWERKRKKGRKKKPPQRPNPHI